jgi:hypothetical protein
MAAIERVTGSRHGLRLPADHSRLVNLTVPARGFGHRRSRSCKLLTNNRHFGLLRVLLYRSLVGRKRLRRFSNLHLGSQAIDDYARPDCPFARP